MRAAVIEEGLVVNLIEVDTLNSFAGLTCVEAGDAHIGDAWDGMRFVRPATPGQDGTQPAAPVVPSQIAMWQARAILIEDDLLDEVNQVLAAIPDAKARKLAEAKFEYSSTVQRNDPLVTDTFPKVGLTEDEIDSMFIRGEALQ